MEDETGQKKKTRMQAMPVERLLNIEQRIRKLGENGAASVIPGRLVPNAIARKIAQTMAYHPDIPDAEYVYELTQESIARTTARSIVKKARALAAELPKPPAVPAPVQMPVAAPSPAATKPTATVQSARTQNPTPSVKAGSSTVAGGADSKSTTTVNGKKPVNKAIAMMPRKREKMTREEFESHFTIKMDDGPGEYIGQENYRGLIWVQGYKGKLWAEKSRIISGFCRRCPPGVENDYEYIWGTREGRFIPAPEEDGHVRVEDGWIWTHDTYFTYYRKPNARNSDDPWGLELPITHWQNPNCLFRENTG